MSGLALYEIVGQHRELERLAEQSDIPPEVIRDTLDGLEGQLRDKAVSVAAFIRNLQATADQINAAAADMLARAERLRLRAQSLSDYLLFNLQASGLRKIEHPLFIVAVRDNPPAVAIDDADVIPREYFVTPPAPLPRPDRRLIANALKAGQAVPGCRIETRQRLDIQT